MSKKSDGPRILILDIETSPLISYTWGLWDQNIALNQIKSDWHVLAWCAKWLGEDKVIYMDQRHAKNIEDDSVILRKVWELLDECDILVTQNGKAFDAKKLNARFILNGFKPPSPYKHIDTMLLAKKVFAFTSNKLEYMTNKLCVKYKKLVNRGNFSGFELWKECLKGNRKAWKEMELYNRYDVLSLEELYHKLQPWDSTINFNAYRQDPECACACGSTSFQRRGFNYSTAGKFQRFACLKCGAWTASKENLLSKDKRKSIKSGPKG